MVPVRASPEWKRFEPILAHRWFQVVAVLAGSLLGIAMVTAMDWASWQTVDRLFDGFVYIVTP